MYAIVTIAKNHKHIYDVEDDGNIIARGCYLKPQSSTSNEHCITNLQGLGRKFGGTGQLRVTWQTLGELPKHLHRVIYPS